MADEEVATKAPESDAAPSLVPGDTPAQEGASLGEHCVTDRPLSGGRQPSGELSKLDDIDVYISKPSDYPHSPSKLLLFLTNGAGLHSPNNQLQADKFAKEGFLVVMPDLFAGDPAPTSSRTETAAPPTTTPSVIEQVKLSLASTAKSFLIDMWLARQTPERILPLLHRVINGCTSSFADALAAGSGLYAVGYCVGGKSVLALAAAQAGKDEEAGLAEPVIRAGAVAHAALVTAEDLDNVKAPLCLVCVEGDQLFPDEIREEGIKGLKERGVQHEVEVFKGVPHGFAVEGEYEDERIAEEQVRAFGLMVDWLKGH
ncbi:MAG: hypothetical protein M1824_006651 [Vezdaea acicularis]|nr:MAG: hypothetical protein M1824_006651 [Vezdaea acicularis]